MEKLNRLLLLFILLPLFCCAQDTLTLTQLPPDPFAIKKSSFHRTLGTPLPLQQVPLQFGDSLLLRHYYIQKYLITDTSKVLPVWFSVLMGWDGEKFWLSADTDYNGKFDNEQVVEVDLPSGIFEAKTGEKYHGEILRYDLDSFPLIDAKWHHGFPLFLQPIFAFYTADRGIDHIIMNTALVSGHKVLAQLAIEGQDLNFAIQLFPLMSDFSLFEFYNVEHQKMCMINILESGEDQNLRLIAYKNAFSFLANREPVAIESKKIYISLDQVDFRNKTLAIQSRAMLRTPLEERLDACEYTSAIDLKSSNAFKLPTRDSIIFYFTGSWCAPCKEMTPMVEAHFKNLPVGWKGYVVANEKHLTDATKYFKPYAFENRLFEALNDRSECSLKQFFSIGLYPSFVYLSPDGKLLWQGLSLRDDKASSLLPSSQ